MRAEVGQVGGLIPLFLSTIHPPSIFVSLSMYACLFPHRAVMGNAPSYAQGLVAKGFVDPNDPSTVYLSQPALADESQRLREPPKWVFSAGCTEANPPRT